MTNLRFIICLQNLVGKVGLSKQVTRIVLIAESTGPKLASVLINAPGQGIGNQVAPVIDKVTVAVVVPAGGLEHLSCPQTGIDVVTAIQKSSVAPGGPVGPIELLVDDLVTTPGVRVEGRPAVIYQDNRVASGVVFQLCQLAVLLLRKPANLVGRVVITLGKSQPCLLGVTKVMVGRQPATSG